MSANDIANLSVSELMTESKYFSTEDKITAVVGYLKEVGGYDVFVEDEGRTSIVTLRDLLEVRDLETRLSKVMRQVPRLSPTSSVGEAAGTMFEYRARSMPVYRGRLLVGKITASSIVGKLLESERSVPIASIMTANPITLEPSASVSTARQLMRRRKVDQIPVVDNGKVVNVVTSANLVFNLGPTTDRVQKGGRRPERDGDAVDAFGRETPVTNSLDDKLRVVYLSMQKNNSNYSVLMDEKGVQGIVTYRDFMKLLTKKEEGGEPPAYVVGIPDELFEASLVRQKFADTVRLLGRVMPDIVEARAVIEAEGNNPAKKKNLVKVVVVTSRKRYSYETFAYDLGGAFDHVHSWAKRLVEQEKPSRRPGRKNAIARRGRTAQFPE